MGFAFRFAMGLVFVWSQVYGQTDDLTLKSKVGKDLMAAGKFEEAMPVYRELVKALPDNPGPVMNLGMALHMAGHEREAVKEFQEVLKLEPAHMPAHLFLGAAYLVLKEPSKAVEPLQIVVRGQPDNSEARLLLDEGLLAVRSRESKGLEWAWSELRRTGEPKLRRSGETCAGIRLLARFSG
ncbi:MAG: hypothetical protein DMG39_17065 [Acidobacteria bacterium]|nr:MAG: hypothetical protein DMG39_17065 [Acidobacteriota bacterium]